VSPLYTVLLFQGAFSAFSQASHLFFPPYALNGCSYRSCFAPLPQLFCSPLDRPSSSQAYIFIFAGVFSVTFCYQNGCSLKTRILFYPPQIFIPPFPDSSLPIGQIAGQILYFRLQVAGPCFFWFLSLAPAPPFVPLRSFFLPRFLSSFPHAPSFLFPDPLLIAHRPSSIKKD